MTFRQYPLTENVRGGLGRLVPSVYGREVPGSSENKTRESSFFMLLNLRGVVREGKGLNPDFTEDLLWGWGVNMKDKQEGRNVWNEEVPVVCDLLYGRYVMFLIVSN